MRKQKSARADRSQPRKKPVVREESLPVEYDQRVPSATSVADAARQRMISEAAYYRAQKRGFAPGRELDDWLAAETEITQYVLEQEPAAAELH
jgi:Protein of unknown function (DUF2934)